MFLGLERGSYIAVYAGILSKLSEFLKNILRVLKVN